MADEEKKPVRKVQEVEVDGYKFEVDTDMIDDVDTLAILDRIETNGQVAAIVPLLITIMGEPAYKELKAYFVEKDGKDHAAELEAAGKPADATYKPRMRMDKLQDVYIAILDKFDPKG